MSQFPSSSSSFPPPAGGGAFGAPPSGLATPVGPSGASTPAGSAKTKRSKRGAATGQAPSKRVVQKNTIFAAGLAVLAAVFLLVSMAHGTKPSYAAVARTDLPAFGGLTAQELGAISIPAGSAETGAYVAPSAQQAIELALKSLRGQVPQYPVYTGQQLIPQMFFKPLASLGANQRLISIQASPENSVDGYVRAGDRIDVVVYTNSTNGTPATSQTLLSGAIVVYAGPTASALQSGQGAQQSNTQAPASQYYPVDPIPGTYILKIDKRQIGHVVSGLANAANVYVLLDAQKPGQAQPGGSKAGRGCGNGTAVCAKSVPSHGTTSSTTQTTAKK